MSQLEMFAQNIHLLIGLLMAGALLLILITIIWTSINMWIFHLRRRRAAAINRALTTGPDGTALPPRSPGICDVCYRVADEVFHLPSGGRMCNRCYLQQRTKELGTSIS